MYAIDPEHALVPLFVRPKYSDTLQQVGTGIFIDFQSQPFLFTAAHVTDNLEQGELLVPVYGGIHPIDGYVGYIDLLPGMSRNEDEVDIAYYRLNTEFARLMCAHFSPFPQTRCMLFRSALELSVCSVYGYPASRAKRTQGRYRSETATFRGIAASEEVYNDLNLSPDSSIVIHFHENLAVSPVDGRRINPLSPRGVSGGGIFSWPAGHELAVDWSLTTLVGIFHTYKKTEGLLIGTHLITVFAATQVGKMNGFGGVV
jgi:hypothetical protein